MSPRRPTVVLFLLAVSLISGPGLSAYLKIGAEVDGRLVPLRWTSLPVRYFVTNRDVANVSASDLQRAAERAFTTWQGAPGIGPLSEFHGFVNAEPFQLEGTSVIGFQSRPDLDRTLGATTFSLDTVTGEVLEADIFLNTAFAWSVAENGQAGRYDVESIVLHELGHLLGLGHSAIGETEAVGGGQRRVIAKAAVMFPIAFSPGTTHDRQLQSDDRAGITEIYGGTTFNRERGSIGGRVTRGGAGIFGAHVTAFNPKTGESVGAFSLTEDGDFVLSGLPGGVYILRVEPLNDAELESFFESVDAVDVDFKPTYFQNLVAVPAGGSARQIEIKVSR